MVLKDLPYGANFYSAQLCIKCKLALPLRKRGTSSTCWQRASRTDPDRKALQLSSIATTHLMGLRQSLCSTTGCTLVPLCLWQDLTFSRLRIYTPFLLRLLIALLPLGGHSPHHISTPVRGIFLPQSSLLVLQNGPYGTNVYRSLEERIAILRKWSCFLEVVRKTTLLLKNEGPLVKVVSGTNLDKFLRKCIAQVLKCIVSFEQSRRS